MHSAGMGEPCDLSDATSAGVLERHIWVFMWPRELMRLQMASSEYLHRTRAKGALLRCVASWRHGCVWMRGGRNHALHLAAERGDPEGVWAALLTEAHDLEDGWLGAGATLADSVNSKDIFGLTPLHYAAQAGAPSSLRLLLQARADPAVRYFAVNAHNGTYALHFAAKRGCSRCVVQLLEARCDIDAVDFARRTARSYAEDAGRAMALECLVAWGARPDDEILADDDKTVEAARADDMC